MKNYTAKSRKLKAESQRGGGQSAFRLPLSARTSGARGVTLSEVLVSTLVMSIGVVALATLFPISVLRSIQASQMTNAANLRYNAEAQVRTVPELVNIGKEWQPQTNYNEGDAVIPTFYYRRASRPAVYICTTTGTSGSLEPVWSQAEAGNTNDGGADWQTVTLNRYIIDPLGYMLMGNNSTEFNAGNAAGRFRGSNLTGSKQHFGNLAGDPFRFDINRFPAFGLFQQSDTEINNEFRSASAAVLPDSWTQQVESLDLDTLTTTSINLVGVDFNALSQSVSIPNPDLVPDRIILFDDTGRLSHTASLSGIAASGTGTVCSWNSPVTLTFQPVRAKVESLERRYTYLLSVRRNFGGSTHIDVVVHFRRSYSNEDEQVFSAVFREIDRGPDGEPGEATTDDNGVSGADDSGELGWVDTDDKARNFVIVQYSSTGQKPFFKKGGYICDANNLRWYRIIDSAESGFPAHTIASVTPAGYELDTVATGMDRFVRLTLDRNIIENSPLNSSTLEPIPNNGVLGGAILMRGIVDVFPLKPRAY